MRDVRRYLPLSAQQFQILLALTDADRHGYAILLDVESRTGGAMRLGTGTLYTAIAGLAADGLVAPVRKGARTESDANDPRAERRRFYRLTALGREVLEAETARLDSLVRAARRKGIVPA